jgi:hypothetical protein
MGMTSRVNCTVLEAQRRHLRNAPWESCRTFAAPCPRSTQSLPKSLPCSFVFAILISPSSQRIGHVEEQLRLLLAFPHVILYGFDEQ